MAQPPVVYCSTPGIAWVKDAELTLLVDEEQGRSWSLHGIEAAIWDLLTLAYSFPEIVQVVSLLARCGAEEASEIVTALLHTWEAQGIVCTTEGARDG